MISAIDCGVSACRIMESNIRVGAHASGGREKHFRRVTLASCLWMAFFPPLVSRISTTPLFLDLPHSSFLDCVLVSQIGQAIPLTY